MKTLGTIIQGDNIDILKKIPSGSIRLIYIDPPFNTGRMQRRVQIRTISSEDGDRVGFQGKKYETIKISEKFYRDEFDDFIGFLRPRLEEAHRVLASDGSIYFHIDYHEVHYCKILLDEIFGRTNFLNEIIWAYDYGARTRRKWPTKHDNILWYAKDSANYIFNYDELDRIPYMAPGLVGPEKAELGKTPTDVWWLTIVSPTGKEKTGYPTQKPVKLLKRIISASSFPGDTVLDFFAGSGTTGVAAYELGRKFILVDNNPEAIEVMKERFFGIEEIRFYKGDENEGSLCP